MVFIGRYYSGNSGVHPRCVIFLVFSMLGEKINDSILHKIILMDVVRWETLM